jgi:hypothetical protein
LIVTRARDQVIVHAHEDAKLLFAREAVEVAQGELHNAERRLHTAEAAAELDNVEYAALERTQVNLQGGAHYDGDGPARLLRQTRALEDGEMAVWLAHQALVKQLHDACAVAEDDARAANEASLASEGTQRESIQATVLAERNAAEQVGSAHYGTLAAHLHGSDAFADCGAAASTGGGEAEPARRHVYGGAGDGRGRGATDASRVD